MKFAYFTYNKEWLNNQNSGRAFAVLAIMLIDDDSAEWNCTMQKSLDKIRVDSHNNSAVMLKCWSMSK